jgi:Glycosyl transferase family 2
MTMNDQRPLRVAIMTFTYEVDREITFDLLDSLVRSFGDAKLDVFLTDDASPSHVGEQVKTWASTRDIGVVCLRDEQNQGFRGAVDRTVRLLRAIAIHPETYDFVLRIDTDALVIREGIGRALQAACTDPLGLYGVIRYMRPKDRVGLLLDLLPAGLKRQSRNGRIEKGFGLSRLHPVWWWKIGLMALARGFDFGYVEGSCYTLGGQVPRALLERGFLDQHARTRHGLITSEEDVIVTMMCRAAGLVLHEMDRKDPTWKDVNIIGPAVLERPIDRVPYVIHALKANEEGSELRRRIKAKMPLFAAS